MAPATAALEPLEAVNVLVCGPPCAGKTTWVARNAPPSATIVCYDTIAAELGHRGPGRPPFKLGRAAEAQVQQALRRIERGEITNAYVIRTMAGPQRRAELATRIRARIVLLLPDIARWMTQEASGEVRAQSARPPEVPARDAQGGLWVL